MRPAGAYAGTGLVLRRGLFDSAHEGEYFLRLCYHHRIDPVAARGKAAAKPTSKLSRRLARDGVRLSPKGLPICQANLPMRSHGHSKPRVWVWTCPSAGHCPTPCRFANQSLCLNALHDTRALTPTPTATKPVPSASSAVRPSSAGMPGSISPKSKTPSIVMTTFGSGAAPLPQSPGTSGPGPAPSPTAGCTTPSPRPADLTRLERGDARPGSNKSPLFDADHMPAWLCLSLDAPECLLARPSGYVETVDTEFPNPLFRARSLSSEPRRVRVHSSGSNLVRKQRPQRSHALQALSCARGSPWTSAHTLGSTAVLMRSSTMIAPVSQTPPAAMPAATSLG